MGEARRKAILNGSGKSAEDPDARFEKVSRELQRLRDDPQRVRLNMDKIWAWVLLSQLQLALRHPANRGPSEEIVRSIARSLQEAICPDTESELWRLAEEGWGS